MSINFDFKKEIQPIYHRAYVKQWNFLKSARLAGKTKATVKYIVMKALVHNQSALVLRNLSKTNLNSTFAEFVAYLTEKDLLKHCKVVTSPNPNIILPNKSVIFFGGLDKPDSYKGMIGLKANPILLVWFEEASETFKKLSWDEVLVHLGDIRQTYIRDGDLKFIFTFNSNMPGGWLHQKEQLGFNDNEQLIHTSVYDNIYASKEAIEELERFKDTWPEYYRMVAFGEYMSLSDPVYNLSESNLFDGNINMPFTKINIGVDLGRSDPTTFVATGFSGDYRDIYILENHYEPNFDSWSRTKLDLMQFIEKIMNKYQPGYIELHVEYAMEGNAFIREVEAELIKRGMPIMVQKADKILIQDRINYTNYLLSEDRLHIRKGLNLVEQLKASTYTDKGKRIDKDDHSINAFEYSLMCEREQLKLGIYYK